MSRFCSASRGVGQLPAFILVSKSMNNVAEAFFNSPVDSFDLSKDWGRSADDQRHRLVGTGTINSRASSSSAMPV
ncbi:MAG: hypothetical protein ACM4AI_26390 [Acidobacteriota bacterium]